MIRIQADSYHGPRFGRDVMTASVVRTVTEFDKAGMTTGTTEMKSTLTMPIVAAERGVYRRSQLSQCRQNLTPSLTAQVNGVKGMPTPLRGRSALTIAQSSI